MAVRRQTAKNTKIGLALADGGLSLAALAESNLCHERPAAGLLL
jgi:hypothetical protein